MKHRRLPGLPIHLLLCGLIMITFAAHLQSQNFAIDVHAGAFDRSHAVVSFYFPDAVDEGVYTMSDEDGNARSIQVDSENRGWFILDGLAAGSSTRFLFDTASKVSGSNRSAVDHQIDENTILIQSGRKNVLRYYHDYNELPEGFDERYRRGGYIHPVYSPGGVVLTNHLNEQHPHHSGIWSAWTNTEFGSGTPDFWNVHLNTGRVDHTDGLEKTWNGPVFAGFQAKHKFTDLTNPNEPEIALNEMWDLRVFQSGNGYHQFELTVTHTVNTGKPLILPEYRYGGVGFRGHVDWDDIENGTFLTSEGLGRDGHGTRVRWTHIGGHSNGELAGIAILGHPSNFRHPQTVRIHPEEPFFNYAPQQLGDMAIEPGAPYIARYRYITYDGEPDPEKLDRLWNDFAYPPGVTVFVINN